MPRTSFVLSMTEDCRRKAFLLMAIENRSLTRDSYDLISRSNIAGEYLDRSRSTPPQKPGQRLRDYEPFVITIETLPLRSISVYDPRISPRSLRVILISFRSPPLSSLLRAA